MEIKYRLNEVSNYIKIQSKKDLKTLTNLRFNLQQYVEILNFSSNKVTLCGYSDISKVKSAKESLINESGDLFNALNN